MTSRQSKLAGFSNAAAEICVQYRPEKMGDAEKTLQQHEPSIIGRGLGRSYGDSALNAEGVLCSERLDRMLSFQKDSGLLTAEAGVTLADILETCVPHGWMLPVVPGTKHVTLGGAIASNVHGKNHYKQGDFGAHVKSIKLRGAGGALTECSSLVKADLFGATIAGYGLTGFIEEATIQLMPIGSASIKSATFAVPDLDAMLDAFEAAKDEADYMVGWIDHFGKDTSLGRGVFSAGKHISQEQGGASLRGFSLRRAKCAVPFTLPRFVMNKYTMALYNKYRFSKYSEKKKTAIESFDTFFHPLDAIDHWPRLYGKRGFLQYQFLIPQSDRARGQLKDVLRDMQYGEIFSYLTVIKYHGASEGGLLTFSQPGYSVALDFPNTPKVARFLEDLSNEIIALGGQIYLAKDQLLTPPQLADMFKENLGTWKKITERADPECKFQSALSRRTMLKIDKRGTLL